MGDRYPPGTTIAEALADQARRAHAAFKRLDELEEERQRAAKEPQRVEEAKRVELQRLTRAQARDDGTLSWKYRHSTLIPDLHEAEDAFSDPTADEALGRCG